MIIDRQTRKRLFETVANRVIASADELTDLDRAIGDGDHGANMRRGFEAVLAAVDELAARSLGESLKGVGTTLVMKVGGASGPLYGTLFMSLGKSLADDVSREQIAEAFAAAIEAVKARGKSDARPRIARIGMVFSEARLAVARRRAANPTPVRRRCSTCFFPCLTCCAKGGKDCRRAFGRPRGWLRKKPSRCARSAVVHRFWASAASGIWILAHGLRR